MEAIEFVKQFKAGSPSTLIPLPSAKVAFSVHQ